MSHSTEDEASESPVENTVALDADRELVCACVNLNLGDYKSFLSKNAGATFEEVLALTKAGSTCTACLLDLEYYFVEAGRSAGTEGSGANKNTERERVGLKRRLFDFIDRQLQRR